MTRLIDADAFKKILSEHEMEHDKRRSFDDYDCGAANAYEHASDLLDEMPTADRPHGEWIFEKGDGKTRCDGWGCSSCGRVFHTKVPYFAEFLFCPNCGADMREGEQE